MLSAVNPTDTLVGARVVELFAQNAPWHRSLWSIGIILSSAELLEACAAVQSGILSEASLRRLGSSCIRIAGKDPAISEDEKRSLNESLRINPRLEGVAFLQFNSYGSEFSEIIYLDGLMCSVGRRLFDRSAPRDMSRRIYWTVVSPTRSFTDGSSTRSTSTPLS